MENELNLSVGQPDLPESEDAGPSERLELAHVFFMDLVAFSTWPMEEQRQGLRALQEIVLNTPQVRAGERNSRLIRLPTGDGMALVFSAIPSCAWNARWKYPPKSRKPP